MSRWYGTVDLQDSQGIQIHLLLIHRREEVLRIHGYYLVRTKRQAAVVRQIHGESVYNIKIIFKYI